MTKADLPPHVQAKVQRLADATARRILDERLASDEPGPKPIAVTIRFPGPDEPGVPEDLDWPIAVRWEYPADQVEQLRAANPDIVIESLGDQS